MGDRYATKLDDLNIEEVSGVDDPANLIAGFMVMKASALAESGLGAAFVGDAVLISCEATQTVTAYRAGHPARTTKFAAGDKLTPADSVPATPAAKSLFIWPTVASRI